MNPGFNSDRVALSVLLYIHQKTIAVQSQKNRIDCRENYILTGSGDPVDGDRVQNLDLFFVSQFHWQRRDTSTIQPGGISEVTISSAAGAVQPNSHPRLNSHGLHSSGE